ncbi:MAG: DsbA family protein [Pseudomonas sp.]|nr:DsbA family protein [Pseudomonas sp.]
MEDLLASDKDVDLMRREIIEASQMGIQGVPMFIFDGKSGVSGAQPADVLVGVMDKLRKNTAAE